LNYARAGERPLSDRTAKGANDRKETFSTSN
jgi:hypothetical protein